jgi:hypothetical protein
MLETHEEFRRFHGSCSPGEQGLVDQAVTAAGDRALCLRTRQAIRESVLRTAELYWEQAQEDEVVHYRRMFNQSCAEAVIGLKRSAAGCRWLIACWERLERSLAADGTWYGIDRLEAIQFQGHSSLVDDLYICPEAYWTWVHCLAAQPAPKQPDIDLILDRRIMPKALQDRDVQVWRPDPAESRAALAAIVARELPALRAHEEFLRVRYEEPARAEVKEQALARLAACKEEQALLRAQRGHERTYERACGAFLKTRAALVAAGLRRPGGGMRGVDEVRLISRRLAPPTGLHPGCQPPSSQAWPPAGKPGRQASLDPHAG